MCGAGSEKCFGLVTAWDTGGGVGAWGVGVIDSEAGAWDEPEL